MTVVAAVIDEGALTFDLAIACEVFGLDRSDIVDPWYEFMVVAAGSSPVTMQTGFLLDTPFTLADLERADTIVVPGWSDPDHEPSQELCAALGDTPTCRGVHAGRHDGGRRGRSCRRPRLEARDGFIWLADNREGILCRLKA